jgi:NitT/TauT family transport system substrate-binding protein
MTALKFALANKDATLALTHELTGSKPDDPRPGFVFDDALLHKAVDPTLPIPAEKIMWIQDQMAKAGSIAKVLDLAAVTAPEYRERALKKVGM